MLEVEACHEPLLNGRRRGRGHRKPRFGKQKCLSLVTSAATRIIEVDPAVKLAIKTFTASPGGSLQFDVQLERGAPASLILERTVALGSPFVTVTNSPHRFLGNKTFRFEGAAGGGSAAFYRVRAEL
jgi:hypothetical protein